MRLFEFDIQKILAPGNMKSLSKNEKYLCNLIHKHCSDALTAMKSTGKFLYHGSDNHDMGHNKAIVGHTNVDRQPKDIDIFAQKVIDSKLAAAGFKALRANSIFCTGSESQAHTYGSLFYIFPINGFNFTWSPLTHDLLLDINKVISEKDFITKLEFKKTDFADAILSRNEIYINGKFIAISRDYGENFTKQLLESKQNQLMVGDKIKTLSGNHGTIEQIFPNKIVFRRYEDNKKFAVSPDKIMDVQPLFGMNTSPFKTDQAAMGAVPVSANATW
jgi:hypothetical protein